MLRFREASCCEQRGVHEVRPTVQLGDEDGCTCETPQFADRLDTLVDLRLHGGLGGLAIHARSYLSSMSRVSMAISRQFGAAKQAFSRSGRCLLNSYKEVLIAKHINHSVLLAGSPNHLRLLAFTFLFAQWLPCRWTLSSSITLQTNQSTPTGHVNDTGNTSLLLLQLLPILQQKCKVCESAMTPERFFSSSSNQIAIVLLPRATTDQTTITPHLSRRSSRLASLQKPQQSLSNLSATSSRSKSPLRTQLVYILITQSQG